MVGGALWRCHCKPFGHCGIRWHREQRRLHTVVAHSKPSWDSSPSYSIQSTPIPILSQTNPHPTLGFIPIQSDPIPSIHKSFCSKYYWTDADYFFAQSSITIRSADLKIIGTLQDFLQIHLLVYVIAFHSFLFNPESKCFHSHLGTNISRRFSAFDSMTAAGRVVICGFSYLHNFQPWSPLSSSAAEIQNKIRSPQNFSIVVHSELSLPD